MKEGQKAYCTIGLAAVNIIVFFVYSLLGDTEDAVFMLHHGAMFPPYIIENGEYYRLFTCLFLHFGVEHLMNNMIMLAALGWNLEPEIGRIKLLAVYFISGLGGNVISLIADMKQGGNVVSAGASGAVFGLMGALLWVVIRNRGQIGRITRRGMIIMVVLSLYFGFASTGVDNIAHIGGLVCGFAASVVLYRCGQSIRPEAEL